MKHCAHTGCPEEAEEQEHFGNNGERLAVALCDSCYDELRGKRVSYFYYHFGKIRKVEEIWEAVNGDIMEEETA